MGFTTLISPSSLIATLSVSHWGLQLIDSIVMVSWPDILFQFSQVSSAFGLQTGLEWIWSPPVHTLNSSNAYLGILTSVTMLIGVSVSMIGIGSSFQQERNNVITCFKRILISRATSHPCGGLMSCLHSSLSSWWWWWALISSQTPDRPGRSKQLMILWSTKETPAIRVSGHWWKPGGRMFVDDHGGHVIPGMVCAWWFDGEKCLSPCYEGMQDGQYFRYTSSVARGG